MPERQDRPSWVAPGRYGYVEALQSAGLIVAPLLAGFTIALIGVLVDTSSTGIRYRGLALLIFMSAVGVLLFAIQFAYQARQFAVSPTEILAWSPTDASDEEALWRAHVEQRAHYTMYRLWGTRFRIAYHLGILLLLLGLAVVLIPSGPDSHISTTRWAAVVVAGLVAAAEGVWILAISLGVATRRGPQGGWLRRCAHGLASWLALHFPLRGPVAWLSPSYPDAFLKAEKALEKSRPTAAQDVSD